MKCENCKKNEVEFVLKVIKNGKIKYLKLCGECVKQKISYEEEIREKSSFIDYTENIIDEILPPYRKKLTCKNCGMEYGEFRRNHTLKCPFCFLYFKSEIKELIEFLEKESAYNGNKYKYSIEKLTENTDVKLLSLKKKLKTFLDFQDIDMAKEIIHKIKKYRDNEK